MKNRNKKLSFITFIAVSLFAAGEGAARFYLGFGTPPLSISHSTIEYMLRPNQNLNRFGNRFIVNKYGMRAEPFSQHKQTDDIRIMVFGDSIVNGGNLTDHSDLATTLLKEDLQKTLDKEVVVGNVSAGSWGPGNWLAYAREFGFFDADAVALVISSHDYDDNPTFEPLDEGTQPTKRPPSALFEGIFKYLPQYLPKIKIRDSVREDKNDKYATQEQAISKSLQDLRNFLQLASSQVDAVIVLQHWELSEIQNNLAEPGYKRIKDVCDQAGVETISLAPTFRHAVESDLSPYRDHIHPSATGQRLIADTLLESLRDQYSWAHR